MSALPAPLVPRGVDLRDFAFMPLDVARLRDSRIAAAVSGEEFRCAVLLWCAAWHQVPAASLPDDDIELSALAGYGRAVASWREYRRGALHGWVRCSDGRLYHPVVAEKANEAWREKLTHRWKRECDRIRKENKSREAKGLAPLEIPPFPAEIVTEGACPDRHEGGTDASEPSGPSEIDPGPCAEAPQKPVSMESIPFPAEVIHFPTETGAPSDGIPAENALKGQGQGQGQGIDPSCPKRAPPVRTRRAYPIDFEQFWQGYPTDPIMSKAKAGEAWAKLAAEDRRAALAAVPDFAAHCRRNQTYRPVHAVRFLTERRFDGFAPKPNALELAFGVADELRVDFGSGRLVADATVLSVLRRGEWLDDWGPRRGRPGCRLPDRILRALAEETA